MGDVLSGQTLRDTVAVEVMGWERKTHYAKDGWVAYDEEYWADPATDKHTHTIREWLPDTDWACWGRVFDRLTTQKEDGGLGFDPIFQGRFRSSADFRTHFLQVAVLLVRAYKDTSARKATPDWDAAKIKTGADTR